MRIFWLYILPISCLLKAQIVNIETMRWNTSPRRVQTSISIQGDWLQNTRRLFKFHPTITSRYSPKEASWLLFFTGDYLLFLANQELLQSRGFGHLRLTLRTQKPFQYEAFLQGQRNEVWALQFRGLIGVGVRYFFFRQDSLKLYGGIHPFYEHEVILDTTLINRSFRLSLNLTFYHRWKSGTLLGAVLYFQPRLEYWADFRIASDIQWQWKLTSHMNFLLTGWLNYDAFPPNQINTVFYSISPGFQFTF